MYDREHIPLEQGLRPQKVAILNVMLCVRDHIPLEQGLKCYALFHMAFCSDCTIKTIYQI